MSKSGSRKEWQRQTGWERGSSMRLKQAGNDGNVLDLSRSPLPSFDQLQLPLLHTLLTLLTLWACKCVWVCVCVCLLHSLLIPLFRQLWEKADNAFPCVCPVHIIWGLGRDRHIHKCSFSTPCFFFLYCHLKLSENVWKGSTSPLPQSLFSLLFLVLVYLIAFVFDWKIALHENFLITKDINIFFLTLLPGDLCEEVVDPCLHGFDPCQHDSKCVYVGRSYRWVTASHEVST